MDLEFKILIVSDSSVNIDQIKNSLAEYSQVDSIEYKDLKTEFDRLMPDLIVLVQSEDASMSIDAAEYIQSESPNKAFVYISYSQDFTLLRNITRAGALDFFVLPDELSLLDGRIENIVRLVNGRKLQQNESASTSQSFKRGRGQIFSFYSGKGGSGKTLISTAFAQTLKFESTAQVLLLDLNLQFGGVETFLSIESNRSVADLLPVIEELNESHIGNVAAREQFSKLEVLLSPRDAEIAETLTDAFISKLLRVCRRSYDFVIVDLPVMMTEHTYTALEESDKIFYVLNMDTPSITILKQAEELFARLGIGTTDRLELVLNEVGRENEINAKDIKNFIDYPVAHQLRRDIKGIQSFINKSEPLRKEMKQKKIIPFAKDIKKWVLQIVE